MAVPFEHRHRQIDGFDELEVVDDVIQDERLPTLQDALERPRPSEPLGRVAQLCDRERHHDSRLDLHLGNAHRQARLGYIFHVDILVLGLLALLVEGRIPVRVGVQQNRSAGVLARRHSALRLIECRLEYLVRLPKQHVVHHRSLQDIVIVEVLNHVDVKVTRLVVRELQHPGLGVIARSHVVLILKQEHTCKRVGILDLASALLRAAGPLRLGPVCGWDVVLIGHVRLGQNLLRRAVLGAGKVFVFRGLVPLGLLPGEVAVQEGAAADDTLLDKHVQLWEFSVL